MPAGAATRAAVCARVRKQARRSRTGLLGSECLAHTREGAIADPLECEREQGVGELERTLQREVRVVGDSCAAARRLEGDPVQRDDARILTAKGDRARRVILDDAVGERRLAVEE